MSVERYFRGRRILGYGYSLVARDAFSRLSSLWARRRQGRAVLSRGMASARSLAHQGLRVLPVSVALISLLSGCTQRRPAPSQPRPVQSQVAYPAALVGINRLLIAPIEVESGVVIGDALIGDLSEKVAEAFRTYFGREVLRLATAKKLGAVTGTTLSAAALAEIGQQEGADAVIRTRLLRFVERSGSEAGSDRPAELGFRTSILRSGDGKEVWSATYGFKDRALSESLFSIRPEGRVEGGWRRADSLAKDAFIAVADAFAKDRLEQFESSGVR